MITGRDILIAAYPLLNQNGITPLFSEGGFIQAINNGLNNMLSYKGYVWSWQFEKKEVETPVYNTEQGITTDNPILYVNKVFADTGYGYDEYDMHRINSNFPIKDEGYKYEIMGNVITYKLKNTNVTKLMFAYYRGVPHINTLNDEIRIPQLFKTPLLYFTMSEIIPVYHSFEQGRDINYYNKAVQYLEWIRDMDSIEGDRITAKIV